MRISDWSSDVCSSDLIVAARFAVDGRDLAQDRHREQVRRDQEGIKARIVRRTEHRMDEADLLRRPALAAEHQTVRWLERGRSEEHTSELRSRMRITYAALWL